MNTYYTTKDKWKLLGLAVLAILIIYLAGAAADYVQPDQHTMESPYAP